jgi:hypothetical protein
LLLENNEKANETSAAPRFIGSDLQGEPSQNRAENSRKGLKKVPEWWILLWAEHQVQ